MKKFEINKLNYRKNIIQMTRISLLYLLFIMFTLNCFAATGYAESARMSINIDKPNLKEAIVEIKNQTEFDFLYSKEIEPLYHSTEIVMVEDGTIEEVLNQLFTNSQIDYEIVDKTIILKPGKIVSESTKGVGQQSITVSGTVADNTDPLPGVNVTVKGTTTGTITDIDGKYSIRVPGENAILVFTYIGYETQEIVVGNRTAINIKLEELTQQVEEVVVIGYGVQRVREVTGAVASVKSEDINKIASADIATALQGQIAGLSITNSSGAPGATANMQIRGTGSISQGSTPLFVVDGVPFSSLPAFTANEIQSIEVLKDAASASIYGSRASNGVVLITTKQGASGQMRVEVDGYYGITNVRRNIPLINSTADWAYLNMVRYIVGDGANRVTWNALDANTMGAHYNTNWQDLFQVDNAPMQSYSIRLTGGTENLIYNLSTTYFQQDGLWVNSDYERLSTRANAQFKKNKFTANVNMAFNLSERNSGNSSLPAGAIRLRPFKQPIDWHEDRFAAPGSNGAAVYDVVRWLKEINPDNSNGGSANINLRYEILDGLAIQLNAGGSVHNRYRKTYNPTFELYNEITGEPTSDSYRIAQLRNRADLFKTWMTELQATYTKSFGDHNLSLLAVYTMDHSSGYGSNVSVRNFLSNDIQVLEGGSEDPTVAGTNYAYSIIGTVGRIQYNYANRYILQVSARRDGSSRFRDDNRYGVFPSVSLGWNLDQESFYQNLELSKIMTRAKIRASFGSTGNQFIGNYTYVASINQGQSTNANEGQNFLLGNTDHHKEIGSIQTQFANGNVKWETSVSRNIGVDLGFLNGAITFSGDLYYTDKKDMLFPVNLPPSAGTRGGSINMNVGNMTNKGIDLNLAYRKMKGDFQYSVTGVFMMNRNMVTKTNLASGQITGGTTWQDWTHVVKEGLPAGTFYLIPNGGVIKTEEQLEEYKKLVSGARLGDLMYIDTNKDGEINDEDRVDRGLGTPKWEGGLTFAGSYKNFDFSVQGYGTYGNKTYNAIKQNAFMQKRHLEQMNSWTPWNPNSDIPSPKGNQQHNDYRGRLDWFLEDGSFFRIRNVQIGYTIPQKFLSRCRVYISADNLFTFTRYSGNDPEQGGSWEEFGGSLLTAGNDSGNIPVTTVYRLGFQASF